MEGLLSLAAAALPALHAWHPDFVFRELSISEAGVLSPGAISPARSSPSRELCALVDVYTADQTSDRPSQVVLVGRGRPISSSQEPASSQQASILDVASLQGPSYSSCDFHALWARGRGGTLDWMLGEAAKLCSVYDALMVEDELLLDQWRWAPPACQVVAVDPNVALQQRELVPIPWAPGGALPAITRPFVCFRAFSAYGHEAQKNPQRWLQDPDTWNPYFIDLVQNGYMQLCMNEETCDDADVPFRLMFWEEVSSEFVDCLMSGVTPLFFMTPSIYEYVERNVILVPYRFETPQEMHAMVQLFSSPEGILEYGTRVYMQRQSNHILGNLYWRQDARLRALLAASAAFHRHGGRPTSAPVSSLAPQALPQASQGVAEFVVCVVSAARNRHLRDIVRNTWGRDKYVKSAFGPVLLQVFFFLADGADARAELDHFGDIVLMRSFQEDFANIWLKTAAIMKFGKDYFQTRPGPGVQSSTQHRGLQFLFKCDDDAFLDIDAVASDLLASSFAGLYWGHVMALVEPNRMQLDKYYVPVEVYPMEYYPPYARGMAYALSEDLASALGTGLADGTIDPFPYREDVSVGLYLLSLARRGKVRVAPVQRKDAMPIDIKDYCRATSGPPAHSPSSSGGGGSGGQQLLVLHRFRPGDASCLWGLIERRRASGRAPSPYAGSQRAEARAASPSAVEHLDFCSCMAAGQAA